MGEAEFEQKALVIAVQGAVTEQARQAADDASPHPVAGSMCVGTKAAMPPPWGQLAFFAEFLEVSGLFERWTKGCPMDYTSPNAPEVGEVLGTWLLSILDGQRRYVHVDGLRGDAVAPEILGMTKIVSDESLRRALAHLAPNIGKRCPEEERVRREAQLAKSTAWMDTALAESTHDALSIRWILDCDNTIKLLRPSGLRCDRLQPHQASAP